MAARHQRKHERSHPAVFPQRHGLQFGAPERRPRGGATVELAAPENPRLLHAIRAILFTHYRSESCVGNLNPAKALPQTFFNRPAPLVARELLGKFLVRRYRKRTDAFIITETEAYEGFHDKASHAHRGQTKRNAPMFGDAGYWYVYFTYGMHWLLNIVTRERGYPSAVLIRAPRPARNSPRKNRLEAHSAGEFSNGIGGPAPLETGCRWQPPRQRRGSLTGP